MNNNNFQFGREDYLDFLCANYYAVREFCLDYDLILPLSEDLGFIRNYLDDNLSGSSGMCVRMEEFKRDGKRT